MLWYIEHQEFSPDLISMTCIAIAIKSNDEGINIFVSIANPENSSDENQD